jgi:hypothetical protein
MALTDLIYGEEMRSAQLKQVIDLLKGNSGGGHSVSLTMLNSLSEYSLSLRNLDPTNSRALQVLKYDGTVLFQVDKNGVKASADGVGSAATIVSAAGTETLTNKTLTYPKLVRGTTAASASSLTLPTNGTIIPISGTTTITTIPAHAAGAWVILEFSNAGCQITNGSNLKLRGNYVSRAGGTLSLECDGVNWDEIGRSGVGRVSFVTGTSNPSTSSTSLVDLSMDSTMTLDTIGGDVVVFLMGSWSTPDSDKFITLGFQIDSSSSVTRANFESSAADKWNFGAALHRFSAPSLGSHTIKAKYAANAGQTLTAGSDRVMLAWEVF